MDNFELKHSSSLEVLSYLFHCRSLIFLCVIFLFMLFFFYLSQENISITSSESLFLEDFPP